MLGSGIGIASAFSRYQALQRLPTADEESAAGDDQKEMLSLCEARPQSPVLANHLPHLEALPQSTACAAPLASWFPFHRSGWIAWSAYVFFSGAMRHPATCRACAQGLLDASAHLLARKPAGIRFRPGDMCNLRRRLPCHDRLVSGQTTASGQAIPRGMPL